MKLDPLVVKTALDVAYNPAQYWEARAAAGVSVAPGELGAMGENMVAWLDELKAHMGYMLEVGPGDGRIYRHLREYGITQACDYVACDISPVLRGQMAIRTGIRPDLWDGVTLPYEDDSYDWLILYSVLLHVPPADIKAFMAEMVRVMRKYIFISTYNGPREGLAPHCFLHNYTQLFIDNRLRIVKQKPFVLDQQIQWVLTRK